MGSISFVERTRLSTFSTVRVFEPSATPGHEGSERGLRVRRLAFSPRRTSGEPHSVKSQNLGRTAILAKRSALDETHGPDWPLLVPRAKTSATKVRLPFRKCDHTRSSRSRGSCVLSRLLACCVLRVGCVWTRGRSASFRARIIAMPQMNCVLPQRTGTIGRAVARGSGHRSPCHRLWW